MDKIGPAPELKKNIQALQIIVGAMCLGVLFFLLISLFVVANSTAAKAPVAATPILLYVGLGLTVVVLLVRLVVLNLIVTSGVKSVARGTCKPGGGSALPMPFPIPTQTMPIPTYESGRLFGIYRTQKIVGAAMIEAPAFFMLVTYHVEHRIEAVAVAVVLLIMLLLQIPMVSGVTRWILTQLEGLGQLKRDQARLDA